MSLDVVVVDTMTFAYLKALSKLELIRQVGLKSGKMAVTKAVINQLHRSGTLGPQIQSYCDRRELSCFSPAQGDKVSNAVKKVIEGKLGKLVRRDRVDIELVEVAREHHGCVLTAETGIARLCKKRSVVQIDILVLLEWLRRVDLVSEAECEDVARMWSGESGAGTGAPRDFAGSFAETMRLRVGLDELIAALSAPAV